MEIRYFHKYNVLVRRGFANPLKCTCGTNYVLRATEDGEPLLECFSCDSIVQPGLRMYENVRAVVKEFFD